ncbi:MAG: hypothetical protein ABI210_10120, partial [Abditibacteriaceae bacterium]
MEHNTMNKITIRRLLPGLMLCPLAILAFIQPGFCQTGGSMAGMATGQPRASTTPSTAAGQDQMGKGAGGGDMNGMPGMQGTAAMSMKAMLGSWSAHREGSGTSWQPDSAPMFMKMLPSLGGFELGAMGTLQAGYVDAGGKRGDNGFFSNSMIMLMGRKEVGGGTVGLHFMTSLDPILDGARGVPNLFQNGFTVHGVDIGD